MNARLSRRDALKGTALLLGFHFPLRAQSRDSSPNTTDVLKPNAWVRIAKNNQITILTEVPEMGQGTRTANVMMLADELEVEWASIQWE